MLVGISLSSCKNNPPKVTLYQLDLKHNLVNPFKIVEYNKKTCSLDIKDESSFELSNMNLHGAICLSPDDYSKYKAWAKTECENEKNKNVDTNTSNTFSEASSATW